MDQLKKELKFDSQIGIKQTNMDEEIDRMKIKKLENNIISLESDLRRINTYCDE